MFSIDADFPITIRFTHDITADIKRMGRQGIAGIQVFLEQVRNEFLLLVMDFSRFLLVGLQQLSVEFIPIIEFGDRDEQVIADIADLVLDVPFFMSCPGRTESAQEIVLGMESGKQFCFLDFILDAMAHAGCIVENQQPGDTTDVFKNMFQSFTDTFRGCISKDLFITVVAVREGDDQIFQPFFVPLCK